MRIEGSACAVTGAASGIGAALAKALADGGVTTLVLVDLESDLLALTAEELRRSHPGIAVEAFQCDVSDAAEMEDLIDSVEHDLSPLDLWCSNAGILAIGFLELDWATWQRSWEVNVAAHVHAARVLVPRMIERGGGNLLHTASAAGLLSQIGSGPYSVTKHAAVGFAEWLAITYGSSGLKVSLLCPQAVDTAMTSGVPGGGVAGLNGMLSASEVADAALEGLREDMFLILPHPEVRDYMRRKADDTDRWVKGMQRLNDRVMGGGL